MLKRFQLYKQLKDGRLMHITSIMATSLEDAYIQARESKCYGDNYIIMDQVWAG